jgi:DNA-binding response OmpR family regulator
MSPSNSSSTVLVVDDDALTLRNLTQHLKMASYDAVAAKDGAEAWALLTQTPERFDAVLLDRMLPKMDGIELLGRIKSCEDLKMLPVILQTSMGDKGDVLEGLKAGACYYLAKPLDRGALLAIIKRAVAEYGQYKGLVSELQETAHTLLRMQAGTFCCRSIEETRSLASLLATGCPEPERVVVGLSELLTNAVEHGNLGITYDEKSTFSREELLREVDRRMEMPGNAVKSVTVGFERTTDSIRFTIKDQGPGFDWRPYVKPREEGLLDTHGRGIALAVLVSFDHVEYRGNGNEVVASVTVA